MAFSKKNLRKLVKVAVDHKASDIHIRMYESPLLRIRGELVPIQTEDFSYDDVENILKILLNDESSKTIDSLHEVDGSYDVEEVCRVRYNIFKYDGKIGVILRIINSHIPTIRELKLSKIISKISEQKRGLILVAGSTSSGKTTTLAAMVNHINQNRSCHIITIEDPIEYIHPQERSRISQREIGIDTVSYASALRAALRQDPDIILIGEMRDAETVSVALKAAETGHLVMSTVHTTNAVTTISRIISMFPPEEKDDVRKRLSETLYATVCQRILKGVEKGSVAIAQEILITNPGVKECIRGDESLDRIHQIVATTKERGANQGQSFDQHIMQLFEKGIITKKTAVNAASYQSDFMQKLLID